MLLYDLVQFIDNLVVAYFLGPPCIPTHLWSVVLYSSCLGTRYKRPYFPTTSENDYFFHLFTTVTQLSRSCAAVDMLLSTYNFKRRQVICGKVQHHGHHHVKRTCQKANNRNDGGDVSRMG